MEFTAPSRKADAAPQPNGIEREYQRRLRRVVFPV
jgi:hypothetical protein